MISHFLKLIAFFCFLIQFPVFSQKPYYNWTQDQATLFPSQWHKSLIIAPNYMGPNALPVPEIQQGIIKDNVEIEFAAESHFKQGKGDKTFNPFVKLYYPIAKNRVAIEIYGVPAEYYRTKDTVRYERNIVPWKYKKNGFSFGDVYIGTLIQLLRNKKIFPDLTLGFYLRTASGNNLENARFSDTPGYFFNLNLGKTFDFNKNSTIRLYSMLGFYVWQTYSDIYKQDDALLYGLGADLSLKDFVISTGIGGYQGYIQGDKPVVYRLNLMKSVERNTIGLAYEYGIRHFPFHSFSLSYSIQFKGKEKD